MTTDNTDRRSVIMTKVMPPTFANFSGHVHGGHLMQFLDYVSYVCATRYCGLPTVTVSVDSITFQQPVYIGELITCYASVNYVGRTSMEIGIRTEAENLVSGKKRHVISCYFTFVAIDEKTKRPTAVKPLTINNAVEERRYEAAKLRRELRGEYAKRHQEIKIKNQNNPQS
ncbi:MAG: acyl-CoA thioesterase [Pseudomonadota bacterium]